MKVIIIDDERLARKEVSGLLKPIEGIELVGEFGDAEEALDYLSKHQVDLVFLDIQMPGKTGFDLLEELSVVPKVIFVTAYDEFAIKAFEYNAFDYLLKPVEESRLREAVDKVKIEMVREHAQDEADFKLRGEDQVFVKDGDRCWFVKLKKIRLFESEGNYVRVYFDDNKPLILKSLNNLEKKLNERKFFRANRKYIINLDKVTSIENWYNGGLMVTMEGDLQVEISRRQSSRLKDMMSL